MTDDLFGEAMARLDLADERVVQMRRAGVQFAENKGAYEVAVHDATLREKAKGTAASNIHDIVKGIPEVSALGVARDCAEVNYKAFEHEINLHKLRARILNDQLGREWGSVRGGA